MCGTVLSLIFFTTLRKSLAEELQYDAVGNFFPSCVSITEVYPDQASVLNPVTVHGVYSIQITFSKPVVHDNRTKFILTPVLSGDLKYGIHAEKITNWRGSQRKLALFFRINQTNINTP